MKFASDFILTEMLNYELGPIDLRLIRIDINWLLSVIDGHIIPTEDELKGILLEVARIGNKEYYQLEQKFKVWL